jgi:glycosyltransferase involved in cell wall biosynthesis
MKVALVHDYIKEYGGAERVLTALHEVFPDAPVYTTVYMPEFLGPHKEKFKGWDIHTSHLQNIPFKAKLISPFRVVSPWYFENINFNEYDVVLVSSTGAYFSNLIVTTPDTLHISYCHTPPRYLHGYSTARNWSNNLLVSPLIRFVNSKLKWVDYAAGQRPDYFIVNSQEVAGRVKKFYGRESQVIYPPVEIVDTIQSLKYETRNTKLKKDYFVAGGRLARAKRIDLLIETANKMKLPLKIFGRSFAGYEDELKKMAGPTIEFLGEIDDEKLIELYKGAKALLYAAEQEDFGIMPVEAQACGTPVIGPNSGGVKETVIEEKTGVLFGEFQVGSIALAIHKFNRIKINLKDCMENAKRFSKKRFQKEIKEFIDNARTSRS